MNNADASGNGALSGVPLRIGVAVRAQGSVVPRPSRKGHARVRAQPHRRGRADPGARSAVVAVMVSYYEPGCRQCALPASCARHRGQSSDIRRLTARRNTALPRDRRETPRPRSRKPRPNLRGVARGQGSDRRELSRQRSATADRACHARQRRSRSESAGDRQREVRDRRRRREPFAHGARSAAHFWRAGPSRSAASDAAMPDCESAA